MMACPGCGGLMVGGGRCKLCGWSEEQGTAELTPAAARAVCWDRQGGRCALCWEPMHRDAWQCHHRRSRRWLGWYPSNVVGLHARCHTMSPTAVHSNPEDARRRGLIVPRSGPAPSLILVRVEWPWEGWGLLTDTGDVTYAAARDSTWDTLAVHPGTVGV